MKIKKITWQNRRDFRADYECESCGHISKDQGGYDDSHFHREVIPSFKCPECGKTAKDAPEEYRPLETRYPDGMQV